jgi:hypothetical protein
VVLSALLFVLMRGCSVRQTLSDATANQRASPSIRNRSARRGTTIQSNYVRAPARPACRSGHTTRRGASRSRVCRRVGFHVGHLWSFGVRRSATPFPCAPSFCCRNAVALTSVGARSRHYLPVLVHDNEFDGVTRHACSCHVGGKRIERGECVSDSLVLALHRVRCV